MDLTKTSSTDAVSTSANPVSTSVNTKLLAANLISTGANMESTNENTTTVKRPENTSDASDNEKIVKKVKIDQSSLGKIEKTKNPALMASKEKSDELQIAGKKIHSKMKKEDDGEDSSSGESSQGNSESGEDETKDYTKVGVGSMKEGNISAVGLGASLDFQETPEGCIRPGPNYQKDEVQIKVPEENQNLSADNVEEGSGSHYARASVIVWDLSRK